MKDLNKHIQYNFDNFILTITLCAKPKNYIIIETLHELVRIVKEFEQNESGMRLVILKGESGSGFFSNGFHPDLFLNQTRTEINNVLKSFLEFFRLFFSTKTPLFMCINGHSMGVGTILALCSEYIGMLEGPYRIGLPEVALGMQVPKFITELLHYKVSPSMVPDMLIYGKFHKAKEAKDIGLVRDIAPTEDEIIKIIKKKSAIGKRLHIEGIHENTKAYREYRFVNIISLFEEEFTLIVDSFLRDSVQEKFTLLKKNDYNVE